MTFIELRNDLISAFASYLGIPIVLSDQVEAEMPLPYGIYSVLTPYDPEATLGTYETKLIEGGLLETRKEQPTCSFSFTFCSMNRKEGKRHIFGEDEALMLAEKAQGWFLHVGYDVISSMGITVVDVGSARSRSTLMVNEEARRYGFDVQTRYVRTDKRKINTIKSVGVKKR